MQFFIDTADLEEIKKVGGHIPIDGVTTNPSLIAKTGLKIEEVIPKIADLIPGPVSAEVLETEEKPMLEEARKLHRLHKNVVVKIPLIESGLKVVKQLSKENIPTNVTLCFSPLQALLAGRAGASIVSIFAGRLDDIGSSGMEAVGRTLDLFSHYDIKTKVLAASIRHNQHILESALLGADIVTAPPKILMNLAKHPLTDIGLKQFLTSAGRTL